MRRAWLLALLLAAPGCLDAFSPPRSCDALAAQSPSENAPLASVLKLESQEIAERLARAVGDELVGSSRVEQSVGGGIARAWNTTRGLVEMFPPTRGEFQLARIWSRDHVTPMPSADVDEEELALAELRAADDFAAALAEFGLTTAERGEIRVRVAPGRLEGEAQPTWGERGVIGKDVPMNLGASFWQNAGDEAIENYRMQITIAPTFDLSGADARLTERDAKRVAELAAECEKSVKGDASDSVLSVGIAKESLAWIVPVAYSVESSCAGQKMRSAWVDAMTGASLGVSDEGPNCIE